MKPGAQPYYPRLMTPSLGAPDLDEIRIKDGSAYYCGLETYGNVWLRPVCSAKIHHRRADELREGLSVWEASGHAATLVTITVPHDLDDPLSRLGGARSARAGAKAMPLAGADRCRW